MSMELDIVAALTPTVSADKARAFAFACRREKDDQERNGCRGVDVFFALVDMGVPGDKALAAAKSIVKNFDEGAVREAMDAAELERIQALIRRSLAETERQLTERQKYRAAGKLSGAADLYPCLKGVLAGMALMAVAEVVAFVGLKFLVG